MRYRGRIESPVNSSFSARSSPRSRSRRRPRWLAPVCGAERATAASVGRPSARLAWRAELLARTPLWNSGPDRQRKSRGSIAPRDAAWLLVLRAAPDRMGRCWLQVRLPSRPNDAAAWLNADRVHCSPRHGASSCRAAHGRSPSTATVSGSAASAWSSGRPRPHRRWVCSRSWASALAPGRLSGLLRPSADQPQPRAAGFGGGDGRVGIHGRGGASLLDPLGSARSHGCIRMANGAIDWLVRTVGADALPGIPVRMQ